jgi:cyclomaltodextrinase
MELKVGKYRHYKGKDYEVLYTATHSETLEKMVVYKQLYGDHSIWVRPYEMFVEEILVGGELIARFKLIRNQ